MTKWMFVSSYSLILLTIPIAIHPSRKKRSVGAVLVKPLDDVLLLYRSSYVEEDSILVFFRFRVFYRLLALASMSSIMASDRAMSLALMVSSSSAV